jgi:hypothetical protein
MARKRVINRSRQVSKAGNKVIRKSKQKSSRNAPKKLVRKISRSVSKKTLKKPRRKVSRKSKKASRKPKRLSKNINSIAPEEHIKLTKNLKSKNGMEMYDIVDKLPKDYYLTKKDLSLIKNKKITVALFDRNFEEYGIWNKFDKYKLYDPVKFFEYNKATIEYNGGNTWKITMDGDENVHFIEVDVVNIRPKNSKLTWSPINDKGDLCCLGKKVNFNDVSNDTRIGWRGPMILWHKIVKFDKKVYQADLSCIKND